MLASQLSYIDWLAGTIVIAFGLAAIVTTVARRFTA